MSYPHATEPRSIGVSNYNLEQLQDLVKTARVMPAVDQVSQYNVILNFADPIRARVDFVKPLQLCRTQRVARVRCKARYYHRSVQQLEVSFILRAQDVIFDCA